MPLATKNNAIIVKDGKVAENCGCCGDGGRWLCCEEKLAKCGDQNIGDALRLTATVSAQDYVKSDLASGCTGCSNGQVRWTCGTYIWPGDTYAGTYQLTPRRLTPPERWFGNVVNSGVFWLYEHFFDADDAGCTGPCISVWVNILTGNQGYGTTVIIHPLSFNYKTYTYIKEATGGPSPETKTLSDMKCGQVSSGPLNVCGGGVREFYNGVTLSPYFSFAGAPMTPRVTRSGFCSVLLPQQITGQPFSVGTQKIAACSYDAAGGPENYSVISETGSTQVSGSLLVEQL